MDNIRNGTIHYRTILPKYNGQSSNCRLPFSHATINEDILAGHIRTGVAGKEDAGASDIVRFS